MDYEIYERDNGINEVWSIADWKDAHYQCNVYTKTVEIRRKVSRDGKVRTEYPRFRAVFQRRSDIPPDCFFSLYFNI